MSTFSSNSNNTKQHVVGIASDNRAVDVKSSSALPVYSATLPSSASKEYRNTVINGKIRSK